MSISLLSSFKRNVLHLEGSHRAPSPTHASMLAEHERRKGAELRHRLAHERRFSGEHRVRK